MITMRKAKRSFWLLVPLSALIVLLGWAQSSENKGGFGSQTSADTAIRFFYQPAGNYFHAPLIFQVVGENDPQLATAPMSDAGRSAFIRLSEMKALTQGLERLGLTWKTSQKAEVFGPAIDLNSTGNMDITIRFSKSTALAELDPKNICSALDTLGQSLSTPRAQWEFQKFRLNYGCSVPGFNPEAYPDHFYK